MDPVALNPLDELKEAMILRCKDIREQLVIGYKDWYPPFLGYWTYYMRVIETDFLCLDQIKPVKQDCFQYNGT